MGKVSKTQSVKNGTKIKIKFFDHTGFYKLSETAAVPLSCPMLAL